MSNYMETRRAKSIIFLILSIISHGGIKAQTGGRHIYQFINLAPSARISAMGGMAIGWQDTDPTAAYQNPALLNDKNHTQLSFNQQFYFADIKSGHFSYTHRLDSLGLIAQFGVQYINYGDINQADVFGNQQGTFPSYESNFFVVASKKLNERITTGASVQWINSLFDGAPRLGFRSPRRSGPACACSAWCGHSPGGRWSIASCACARQARIESGRRGCGR